MAATIVHGQADRRDVLRGRDLLRPGGQRVYADAIRTSTQPGGLGDVTLTTNPTMDRRSSVTISFSGSLASSGSLIDGFYNFKIDANQVIRLRAASSMAEPVPAAITPSPVYRE